MVKFPPHGFFDLLNVQREKNASVLAKNLKTILRYFLIVQLFPFSCLLAQYQNLRFEHITIDDGLSKSSVTCIIQDKEGFMWVGTFNGLNRYDGYDFTVYQYNQEDSNSISHNYISSIMEDHQGVIWVGTSDGLNRYNRSTDNFTNFRNDEKDSTSINDNQIEAIFEDSQNRLWVGTRNGGLELYDRANNSFIHYLHDQDKSGSLSSNSARTIFEDHQGNLWVGQRNGIIDILEKGRSEFTHLKYNGRNLASSTILTMTESEDGNLWLGTQGDGMFRVKFDNGNLTVVNHYVRKPQNTSGITGNVIYSLMLDRNGKLWIGTEDEGLNILDIGRNEFYHYRSNPVEYSSLNNNSIYIIYEDNIGDVWIGTYTGGINLLAGGRTYFQYYRNLPGDNKSLGYDIVNGFWEDSYNNIWIGTNGGGLEIFDRDTKTFTRYNKSNNSFDASVILSLYEDSRHNFWVGTWGNGLYKINRRTKEVVNYTQEKNGLGSNNIFQIIEGKPGELWLCTFWGGLTYFNTEQETSVVYSTANSSLNDDDLRAIAKDHFGNFWIGTDVGLVSFNPETKTFNSYQHDDRDKSSLSKGFVSCLLEASDSTLWIGTTGGLNKFDRKTNSFIHYYRQDGLSNDEIMCIVEDDSGILWISTSKGIARLDPQTEVFKNYDVTNGLQGNEFNARSGYKTKDGEILFGGIGGINMFRPKNLKNNPYVPPVIINDFKIFNKPVAIGKKDSPLKKNITETRELVLSYKHSVFSFGFVALNYISPEKNKYAYMMEGFEHDWNYVGSNRTATYTNLDPGDYTFKVKASNNDGVWNNEGASLKITIEPPFWKTWWAYLLESIMVMIVLYLIANYFISRQRLKNALKMEHLELEKMYELDQMKTQFFSNISHEFQSPITLILNPLEKLITSFSIDEKVKNSLMLIHRNANRLKRMTNQIKDLNKLETGDLQLYLSKGDIVQFIKDIYRSFYDYAKDHKINFLFNSKEEQYTAWFDPDKVDKIIYNLLSNAFKFTPDEGQISVDIAIVDALPEPEGEVSSKENEEDKPAKYIKICVEDNGIGISKEKIDLIFKRNYHLEDYKGHHYEGSGVGLAFVYELINLYRGVVSVKSAEGEGTTFTIHIPLDEHYLEENQLVGKFKNTPVISGKTFDYQPPKTSKGRSNTAKGKSRDIPVVLIAEDDKEIRDYLKQCFDENYRVVEAENGQLGCKKALQMIPDLIITDIKMNDNDTDGIELCKTLKNDEKTSHIPIIMLTAFSSREYQMKGLAEGADVYLTKPFNVDVLEAHMTNLLDNRKKLQEKFGHEFILGPEKIPVNDIDEKFLKRVTEIVEEHMADEKLNADMLSEKIGMSRMQLYRKLRGLTNQTVHEFIRNIRLKRAVQLLEQKKMTITEVAYEVGFNDLTYFARCFRKQFDKSPSEYISSKG